METKSWKDIKDNVYGVKGTDRRDELINFCEFSNEITFETPDEMNEKISYFSNKENNKKYHELKNESLKSTGAKYLKVIKRLRLLESMKNSEINFPFGYLSFTFSIFIFLKISH